MKTIKIIDGLYRLIGEALLNSNSLRFIVAQETSYDIKINPFEFERISDDRCILTGAITNLPVKLQDVNLEVGHKIRFIFTRENKGFFLKNETTGEEFMTEEQTVKLLNL